MNRTKRLVLSLPALLCSIVVMAQTAVVTKCEYWIDRQIDSRTMANMTAGELTTQLDMSALPVGLHSITVRTGTDDGRWGSPIVKHFIVPQAASAQENTLSGYEYWIDRDINSKVSGTFNADGIVVADLDMSALPAGLHSLSFRALDDNGHVSSLLVRYFLVPQAASAQENGLVSFRYWIDKDIENAVEGTVDATGVIDMNIELENLDAGLHNIGYQVKDQQGVYSPALFSYFLVPDDAEGEGVGDKIVAYEYWFNDNPRKRVEVEPTAVLTIDEAQLLVEGVEPETVLPDYVFDVATMKVVYTQDVNFGLQVFNNLGTGSVAVTQTIEGYQSFEDTQMQTLVHETASTLAAPTGSKVQGYQYNCNVGDKLYWFMDLAEGTTVDFYDADGTKIDVTAIEVETVGEKQARTITAPTATVYALVYGATADEATNTIKVAQPVTITINNAERKYGAENPTFTYTSEEQALIVGTPTFATDADETSAVGEYPITLNAESISNTVVTVNNGTLTVTKADGYISYETTAIEKMDTDAPFINPLTIVGDGTVFIVTDNEQVATVDAATGEVTIVGAGEAVITATVTDGMNYTYTTKTACYTVTVTAYPTGINTVAADSDDTDATWYDLNGRRLAGKPAKKGIYIRNGRKLLIRAVNLHHSKW